MAERHRQLDKEGWTAQHDAQHENGEMGMAAACYAVPFPIFQYFPEGGDFHCFRELWPWDQKWNKRNKHNRIRQLEIAGALCAAEIDRLLALERQDGHQDDDETPTT